MPTFQTGQNAARGITFAIIAAICFSLNDMLIKLLSSGYPLHELVFIRSVVALALTLAIIMPLEGGYANMRTKRPGMHIFRGMCVVVANSTFFAGLVAIPLATASAIFFVAPLIITGLSVIVLREKVGVRRWAAVLVGLLGVLVVVRPGGAEFSFVMLLPVVAAAAYASMQITTRFMGFSEKASTMAMYLQLTFLMVSALVGLAVGDGRFAAQDNASLEFLLRAWVWPNSSDWGKLVATGILSGLGGYSISMAYRGTPAGLVAPFEYVALPLSVLWGLLIWQELPDSITWLGIALIILAGVYIAIREAAQGRRPSAKRMSGRR